MEKNMQPDNIANSSPECGRIEKTKVYSRLIWGSCLLLIFAIFTAVALADDHGDKHEKHEKHKNENSSHDDHDDNPGAATVTNPDYSSECGACHFAYPPGLLPSASWRKIIAGMEDHFGENIVVDTQLKDKIIQYLSSNAADLSSAEVSIKIMKGIDGQIPTRITEIPYIIKKHRELAPAVLKRPAIGSLSNCAACHKTANQGDFDDDGVVIPK